MLALLNCGRIGSSSLHHSRARARSTLAGRRNCINTIMNLIRYFAMDKYAVYIWGSYGVSFVLLAGEVLMLIKRKRNLARRANAQIESHDSQLETSFQEIQ